MEGKKTTATPQRASLTPVASSPVPIPALFPHEDPSPDPIVSPIRHSSAASRISSILPSASGKTGALLRPELYYISKSLQPSTEELVATTV